MPNMTWVEAIRTVLRASDEPMHYTAIAQAVLDNNYRTEVGATPAATVAAYLSQLPLRSEVQRVERGVHHLSAGRAYRWEFRRASLPRAKSPTPIRSWWLRSPSCVSRSSR